MTPAGLHYNLWEADKTQVCVCDGGYFGLDCSQRQCMKNDDPLTDISTKLGFNYGITERDEVQYVDVRCRFNGKFVHPPTVALLYTDAQFGDVYETAAFDVTAPDASNVITTALKALPNQVLADFVDPVGGSAVQHVQSAAVQTLEVDNHYRVIVTFDNRLGDVPTLGGNAYFKCRGGAEVLSSTQNVGVTYSGDGPREDLTFASALTGMASIAVTNAQGAAYQPVIMPDDTCIDAVTGELSAAGLTGEAAKVTFYFSGGARQAVDDVAVVHIHTRPVVDGFNPTYALQGAEQAILAVLSTPGTAHGTFRLSYRGANTDFITFDTSATADDQGASIQTAVNALPTIQPGFVVVLSPWVSDNAKWYNFVVLFYNVDTAAASLLSRVTPPTASGSLGAAVTFDFGWRNQQSFSVVFTATNQVTDPSGTVTSGTLTVAGTALSGWASGGDIATTASALEDAATTAFAAGLAVNDANYDAVLTAAQVSAAGAGLGTVVVVFTMYGVASAFRGGASVALSVVTTGSVSVSVDGPIVQGLSFAGVSSGAFDLFFGAAVASASVDDSPIVTAGNVASAINGLVAGSVTAYPGAVSADYTCTTGCAAVLVFPFDKFQVRLRRPPSCLHQRLRAQKAITRVCACVTA